MSDNFLLTAGIRNIEISQIIEKIKDYLTENQLTAGSKLPSERNLSTQLGCSRNTLRTALRELERQGVIITKPGAGSFVSGVTPDYSMVMLFVKKNFLEQLEVKMLIEVQIIRHAVRYATPEQLEILIGVAKKMMDYSKNGLFSAELDDAFHKLLCKISPNPLMRQMVENMTDIFANYWHTFFEDYMINMQSTDYSLALTIPHHLNLALAIKEGDEERAVSEYMKIYNLDVQIFNTLITDKELN